MKREVIHTLLLITFEKVYTLKIELRTVWKKLSRVKWPCMSSNHTWTFTASANYNLKESILSASLGIDSDNIEIVYKEPWSSPWSLVLYWIFTQHVALEPLKILHIDLLHLFDHRNSPVRFLFTPFYRIRKQKPSLPDS